MKKLLKYYLNKLKEGTKDTFTEVASSFNKSYIIKQKKWYEINYPGQYRIYKLLYK